MYPVQNFSTDASPINITSGGYNGMDGVLIVRNSRSTSMLDNLLRVAESDTTVFTALKNGDVGIGTATPTAQLHTTGSVRFAGLTNDSTQTLVLVSDASGNLYYRSVSSLAGDNLIRSSLAVNGPIKAKSLTLSATDWPDYVFDSSYHLPSLSSVENYIRRQHHLPDIPSASAIQKDGLDVGANQTVLMKKIEELTLYNIDQEKRITEQNTKLEAQAKELSSLKAELDELKAMIKKSK